MTSQPIPGRSGIVAGHCGAFYDGIADLIDPERLTNYARNQCQLEALGIYSVLAWGRQAKRAQNAVETLLIECPPAATPYGQVRAAIGAGTLRLCVEATRIGDYAKRRRALEKLVAMDVRTAGVDELSSAVGLKSARLIVLHSRPNQAVAALDRHVLAYLRGRGHDVPEQDTPRSPKRYAHLERLFLAECEQQGRDPAELDLATWLDRRRA